MIPSTTILPLYCEATAAEVVETKPTLLEPQLCLEFHDGTHCTVEKIPLPPSHLLLRPWITILAQWVANRQPTGIYLEHFTIDTAWLPFWKAMRQSTKLDTLSLQSCRFQSQQVALLALLQISHWKYLKTLRLDVDFLKPTTTTSHGSMSGLWELFVARTAPTLERLELCQNESTSRLDGLGRGWTTAHLGGVTGIPLREINLKGCRLGQVGIIDMVEGLSRQQPCRVQVLNLARNHLNLDCLRSLSGLLELMKGSLTDLDVSANPLFPNDYSSSEVDSLEWALSHCQSLQHFSVADCNMSGRVAMQLLAPCRHLKSLNLAKNPIGPVMWPSLMQSILPLVKDLRSLNITGTLLDTSHECVVSYFLANTTLESVVLPSDAALASRIHGYTQRNRRLRQVQSFVASKEKDPAVWAAAYQRLSRAGPVDRSPLNLLVTHGTVHGHGALSATDEAVSNTTTPLTTTTTIADMDDDYSDITAEDWSAIEAIDNGMEEFSIIEAGIL